MKVIKFGGSSLASSQQLQKVLAIVEADQNVNMWLYRHLVNGSMATPKSLIYLFNMPVKRSIIKIRKPLPQLSLTVMQKSVTGLTFPKHNWLRFLKRFATYQNNHTPTTPTWWQLSKRTANVSMRNWSPLFFNKAASTLATLTLKMREWSLRTFLMTLRLSRVVMTSSLSGPTANKS